MVYRIRTGYTRATHRHVIEKTPSPCRMPFLWGVAHNRTHTMAERERRETSKEVWTDGTEILKRLIEYSKKIGLFHGI
jgi:hypothetical protein